MEKKISIFHLLYSNTKKILGFPDQQSHKWSEHLHQSISICNYYVQFLCINTGYSYSVCNHAFDEFYPVFPSKPLQLVLIRKSTYGVYIPGLFANFANFPFKQLMHSKYSDQSFMTIAVVVFSENSFLMCFGFLYLKRQCHIWIHSAFIF